MGGRTVIPQCFTFTQSEPASTWTIPHNLGMTGQNAVPIVDVYVNYEGNLTKIDPMDVSSVSTTVNLFGVATLGAITEGSGYVDGTYTNVLLLGGTGYGARATFVIDNGGVDSVTITDPGVGYMAGDNLNVANAWLGGVGTGYAQSVAAVTSTAMKQQNAITLTFSIAFSGYAVVVQ